jgi:hypothetical protein
MQRDFWKERYVEYRDASDSSLRPREGWAEVEHKWSSGTLGGISTIL